MHKIFATLLAAALTISCSDNLNYNFTKFIGSANTILNSAEDNISTSSPFVTNMKTEGESYTSVLWTKKSGPGDINFSEPTILNPQISATIPGFYEARLNVFYADGSSITEVISFEWLETDTTPPVIKINFVMTGE